VVADSKYGSIVNYLACRDRDIKAHFSSLEETQKHKAEIDSPQSRENHKKLGVESFETWIVERRVAR